RCRARLRRQFAGEYLQAAVDHVEPPAHENQAERLQLPFRPDGHRDELHADHGCTRDHHAVDAEFWQKPRHGQGVEQPAAADAPSRLPVMAPASVRPIATWRFSGPTRSLVRLSATGNTPPEPMPARIRLANSSGNDVAIAPRMLASPSSTRQTIISRALPNMSAMAPSTGWMMAKV